GPARRTRAADGERVGAVRHAADHARHRRAGQPLRRQSGPDDSSALRRRGLPDLVRRSRPAGRRARGAGSGRQRAQAHVARPGAAGRSRLQPAQPARLPRHRGAARLDRQPAGRRPASALCRRRDHRVDRLVRAARLRRPPARATVLAACCLASAGRTGGADAVGDRGVAAAGLKARGDERACRGGFATVCFTAGGQEGARYNRGFSANRAHFAQDPAVSERLAVALQYALPKRLLTQLAGKLAGLEGGKATTAVIRWFIKRYGVNMAEAANADPASYASFNAFFTRPLRAGARALDEAEFVCPVDGAI